jgi:hypothetical protein
VRVQWIGAVKVVKVVRGVRGVRGVRVVSLRESGMRAGCEKDKSNLKRE